MLSGRRFMLRRATLALDTIDGKRVATTVPAGSIILIVSGPMGNDRLLDVLWEGREISMFAIDVVERGNEMTETLTCGNVSAGP